MPPPPAMQNCGFVSQEQGRHAPSSNTRMTSVLRAACQSIAFLAKWAPPRSIPFVRQQPGVPCVYADAYFVLGGEYFKPGHSDSIPIAWNPETAASLKNGFGAVLVLPGGGPAKGYYFDGQVPAGILHFFAHRRQFIFLLEALAQVLAFFVWMPWLSTEHFAFVDNSAAQYALTKGYSSDDHTNVLISLYWAAAASCKASPWSMMWQGLIFKFTQNKLHK